MAQIGTFTRTTDGFAGTVRTLMLNRDLVIVPAETSDADNAPNYRVLAAGVEIGAGWKRTGDKAGDYVSLLTDSPSFRQFIHSRPFLVHRTPSHPPPIWPTP